VLHSLLASRTILHLRAESVSRNPGFDTTTEGVFAPHDGRQASAMIFADRIDNPHRSVDSKAHYPAGYETYDSGHTRSSGSSKARQESYALGSIRHGDTISTGEEEDVYLYGAPGGDKGAWHRDVSVSRPHDSTD